MAGHGDDGVVIDCDSCAVRGDACADCVVTVMLGLPGPMSVEPDEREALEVLASCGLVPRLRMVPELPGPPRASGEGSRRAV